MYEYSQIDDLLHTTGSELVEKLQGIIYYLGQHYFPALVSNGLHILYTTPLWSSPPAAPSYALTDVTFQVYSSVEVTRYNWTQLPASTEPVLAILGMTCGRTLPNHYLSYSTNWVARADRGFSHGTVAISNTDQNVLHRLARINSLTSVIPVLVAADETDGWKLQLTTIAARHCGRGWIRNPQRGRRAFALVVGRGCLLPGIRRFGFSGWCGKRLRCRLRWRGGSVRRFGRCRCYYFQSDGDHYCACSHRRSPSS